MKQVVSTAADDISFGLRLTSDWAGNVYTAGLIDGSYRFNETTIHSIENVPAYFEAYDVYVAKLGDFFLARPQLQMARGSGLLELRWPAGWDNWVLETTTSLGDVRSWEEVTTSPVRDGGSMKVPAVTGDSQRFYRLGLR